MSEITHAIGRRKTSVARIYMKEGEGKMTINSKDLKNYFPVETLRIVVQQPLAVCDKIDRFDINIRVNGGGTTGQAEAIRLAIARALVSVNAEEKSTLKKEGFLRRDPRMVERKKYGRRKARRRFQFSKR